MILIDINKEKELKYNIPNILLVKSAWLIILFEDNIERRYEGIINKKNSKEGIVVKLPIFKNFMNHDDINICFLEIEDVNGTFYRAAEDSILFQNVPLVELKFHETEKIGDVSLKPEIVSRKTTVTKKVSYKKNNKPPKRTEILNIQI